VARSRSSCVTLIDRPERVLTSAAEGDPAHSSDNLLWREGTIRGRYQLKSTRNTKSIIDFLSEPEYVEKYFNEVIVTHPDTFNKIRRELSKRKRLDDSLPPDWQRVAEAFQAGRVSDEIFPGWKVPTYYEAQQKADDVIRSQFERARREYGDD
jgi:cell division protein YceG involved in septum cleavage